MAFFIEKKRIKRQNRGWNNAGPETKHIETRRAQVGAILKLLRKKYPGEDHKTKNDDRLPRIAKSLEYRLYLSAKTMDEYLCEETLKFRLNRILREVYVSSCSEQLFPFSIQEGHPSALIDSGEAPVTVK